MTTTINETHDPSLKSWVASANTGTSDFPVQNLPYGTFRRKGTNESFRPGVAIGDQILTWPRWPHRSHLKAWPPTPWPPATATA